MIWAMSYSRHTNQDVGLYKLIFENPREHFFFSKNIFYIYYAHIMFFAVMLWCCDAV